METIGNKKIPKKTPTVIINFTKYKIITYSNNLFISLDHKYMVSKDGNTWKQKIPKKPQKYLYITFNIYYFEDT